MGDANVVGRIGGCLAIAGATIVTAVALGVGYLGLDYAITSANREFRRGQEAIVQQLAYSPYYSLDESIRVGNRTFMNGDYTVFGEQRLCRVVDEHFNVASFINGNPNKETYRLECPSDDGGSTYGWSVPSRMTKP